MANYSIQRSDLATGNITVTEASTNTATNVTLIGQNFTGYGDEIATNFLQMLENFATDVDPTTNPRVVGSAIRGQLWYDTTGTGTLKIYNGASFDELAKVSDGTTESSTLRWNNTAGRYQAEERVRVTDAGALIIDAAAAGTNAVTISHAAGDLEIAGAGTTNINITGVTAVTAPSLTLTTALAETDGGTGTDTYATGDVLYASGANTLSKLNAGANGEVLTLVAGVPDWVATGAGVTELDDLSDVTLTTPANNSLLYRSAGQYIDSNIANLSFDGTTLNATQFGSGNIASADLIDRSAPGTLAATTFSGNITAQADILLGDNDQLIFGGGSDVIMDYASGGNDFIIDGQGTTDAFWIQGFTGDFRTDGVAVRIDNITGEALRLQGNFTGSSLETYINFRDSANTIVASVGIQSGSNDLVIDGGSDGVDVKGTDGNDKIVVNNGVQCIGTGTEAAFGTAVVGSSFKTTRLSVYDDTGTAHSAGYNETPQGNSGALSSGGTYVVDIDDIGFFLTRTTSVATTIEFGTMVTVPTGATVLVHNDATGTCTISVSGMTLEWVDGSGGAAPTGNRTLARSSVATLRKKSGSVWQIWGNGIS